MKIKQRSLGDRFGKAHLILFFRVVVISQNPRIRKIMGSGIAVMLFTWLLAAPSRCPGQEIIEGNTNTWFLSLTRLDYSNTWSSTLELHERTGNFLSDQGQVLIRPSIDYTLNENVEFSIGYTFVHVDPYAPYSRSISTDEHNIWQQILLSQDIGAVGFQHRFRQENRWIDRIVRSEDGMSAIDGRNYRNRFRYRITLSLDLLKIKEDDAVFITAFDEIWVNQNKNLLFISLARNWIYGGLGYRFDPNANLQLAFLFQSDKVAPNSFINSPVVQLSFFKTFEL